FAAAQDYPAREIRSLCNYAPGSGADLIVRFYSDLLSKLAERPVIVENRVGANGMIASDALAKSRPDGYTIMITPASSTIAAAPYLFKNLPFDTTRDFSAVATIASLSFVILVDAAGPIKSMAELVAHLKGKPGASFYGATSNTGVIAGWFNQITGAEDTKQFLANSAFDPFPGAPEQMQALMKSDAERWKRYVELAKIEPQ